MNDRKTVTTNDMGTFVSGCPPIIALIALNKLVILLSPGELSKITPFTYMKLQKVIKNVINRLNKFIEV